MEVRTFETQSEEGLFDVFFKVRKVDSVEFLAHVRNLLYESHVFIALIVGSLSQFQVQPLYLALHFMEMCKSLRRFFVDRPPVFGHQVLGQIGDDAVLWSGYLSTGGLAHAGKNLEQCGLACTVFAHQCDAVLFVNLKTDVAE